MKTNEESKGNYEDRQNDDEKLRCRPSPDPACGFHSHPRAGDRGKWRNYPQNFRFGAGWKRLFLGFGGDQRRLIEIASRGAHFAAENITSPQSLGFQPLL